MFDYTPEGHAIRQGDIAVAYLDLIDKKLAKLNRRVGVLTLAITAAVIFKNKEIIINKVQYMKGE
jgi:hypothetical protein